MARDQRPQPVGAREVGCALVQHEPSAEHQRPGDRPWAHHPAQVGEPEERVTRSEVELVGEVLGRLDREAAVDVDGTLGSTGRTRGVDEQVGRLGVDVATDDGPVFAVNRVVPPGIAPGASRVFRERPRRGGRRRRDGRTAPAATASSATDLSVNPRAASEEAVRRDQDGRLAIGEAGGDRRCPVAAEDRRVDRLQSAEREHGDHGLDQHRQEDPHPIAAPDPVCRQATSGDIDGRGQLGVRQAPNDAVLAFPDERLAGRVARGPWFDGGPRVVEYAPAPPPGPGWPARRDRAPRAAAAPTRCRCHQRPRPRTSRDRRLRAPAGQRASVRPSNAGSEPTATPPPPRVPDATRRPPRRARTSASHPPSGQA